jgi:hypothetical protein
MGSRRLIYMGAVLSALLFSAVVLLLVTSAADTKSAMPPRPPAPPAPHAGHIAGATCDHYASPRGFDHGAGRGTAQRPFRSVERLLQSLGPGRTGCLEPGTYAHREVVRMARPRTTLRGVGPGPATIVGPIWILSHARGARLLHVSLTSRNPSYTEPLKIEADHALVADDFITGETNTICVLVGGDSRPHGVRIEHNRISHCGRYGKFAHLIYVADAVGTIIRWNLLTDNPGGWGVHLYPNADYSRVEHNWFEDDEGGVIFAGDGGETSSYNVVRNNVILNSSPRRNIESSWSDGPTGEGNRAYDNCLFSSGLDAPSGIGERLGFSASDNLVLAAPPTLANRPGGLSSQVGNACLKRLGKVGGQPGIVH